MIVTEMTSIAERERRDEATGWRGVGARLGVPPRQTQRPEIGNGPAFLPASRRWRGPKIPNRDFASVFSVAGSVHDVSFMIPRPRA